MTLVDVPPPPPIAKPPSQRINERSAKRTAAPAAAAPPAQLAKGRVARGGSGNKGEAVDVLEEDDEEAK